MANLTLLVGALLGPDYPCRRSGSSSHCHTGKLVLPECGAVGITAVVIRSSVLEVC